MNNLRSRKIIQKKNILVFLILVLFSLYFLGGGEEVLAECSETSMWIPNVPYCDGDGDGIYDGYPPCEDGCHAECSADGCWCGGGSCTNGMGCACGDAGGCFLPETKVETPEGEKGIQDIQAGEKVKSWDPRTGEETTSQVEDVYQASQGAYYKIKLKDGQELKVTGEHPLYTIRKEKEPLNFWEYLKTGSLIKKSFDFLQSQISKP